MTNVSPALSARPQTLQKERDDELLKEKRLEKEKSSLLQTKDEITSELEMLRQQVKDWEAKHAQVAKTNAEMRQELEAAEKRLQEQVAESARELEKLGQQAAEQEETVRRAEQCQRRFQEGLLGLGSLARRSHLKRVQRAFSRMHRLKDDQIHFSVVSSYKEEIDRVRWVLLRRLGVCGGGGGGGGEERGGGREGGGGRDISTHRSSWDQHNVASLLSTLTQLGDNSRENAKTQKECNIARGVDKLAVLLRESAGRRKRAGMARWMLHACTDFELAAAAASANVIASATSESHAIAESHAATQQVSNIKVGSVSITSTPGQVIMGAANTPEIGMTPLAPQPIQIEAWLSAMARRFPLQVQTRVANSIQIIRASNAEKRTQALQRELEASKLRAIQIVEESVAQQSEAVSKLQKAHDVTMGTMQVRMQEAEVRAKDLGLKLQESEGKIQNEAEMHQEVLEKVRTAERKRYEKALRGMNEDIASQQKAYFKSQLDRLKVALRKAQKERLQIQEAYQNQMRTS